MHFADAACPHEEFTATLAIKHLEQASRWRHACLGLARADGMPE